MRKTPQTRHPLGVVVKYIAEKTYKPLLVKYLSGTRLYSSNGITIEVPPQVFHPGFFTSTKLLLRNICKLELRNKTLLELGAGSGLIAMHAANCGAIVTATDINTVAIEFLKKNSYKNNINIRIIHSDLFDDIPLETFDIIAINPPYYKKDPQTPAEHAWYCGKNGEYFEKLFSSIGKYIHESSVVMMVLCDGCDVDMISNMAMQKGFRMNCIAETRSLLEKNFIFNIEKG